MDASLAWIDNESLWDWFALSVSPLLHFPRKHLTHQNITYCRQRNLDVPEVIEAQWTRIVVSTARLCSIACSSLGDVTLCRLTSLSQPDLWLAISMFVFLPSFKVHAYSCFCSLLFPSVTLATSFDYFSLQTVLSLLVPSDEGETVACLHFACPPHQPLVLKSGCRQGRLLHAVGNSQSQPLMSFRFQAAGVAQRTADSLIFVVWLNRFAVRPGPQRQSHPI